MQRWAHFNNAHSHYLQVASRGRAAAGAPVAGALVVARRCWGGGPFAADKGEMFWVRVGAAAGLAGLAVQSIWEVALIMPANAVLAGDARRACCSIAASRRRRAATPRGHAACHAGASG